MLELSIVKREKWLAQIIRKYLTERKLEKKKRMEIMLSTSLSLLFFHKRLTISDLKGKYVFYPA